MAKEADKTAKSGTKKTTTGTKKTTTGTKTTKSGTKTAKKEKLVPRGADKVIKPKPPKNVTWEIHKIKRDDKVRKTALAIGGSDPTGGAGIQADMKTIHACGVYGTNAVTALTVQDTTGVAVIEEISPEFFEKQLDCVFQYIYPEAVKVGMIYSPELIELLVEKFKQYKAKNIVVDPVVEATGGGRLLREDGLDALCTSLIPMATLLTPNLPEAEILCDWLNQNGTENSCPHPIKTRDDMEEAARILADGFGCKVLLKGGHQGDDAPNDVLYPDGPIASNDVLFPGDPARAFANGDPRPEWYRSERIEGTSTHGSGCVLSSSIAAYLAWGCDDLFEAIRLAKGSTTKALRTGLDQGVDLGQMDESYVF